MKNHISAHTQQALSGPRAPGPWGRLPEAELAWYREHKLRDLKPTALLAIDDGLQREADIGLRVDTARWLHEMTDGKPTQRNISTSTSTATLALTLRSDDDLARLEAELALLERQAELDRRQGLPYVQAEVRQLPEPVSPIQEDSPPWRGTGRTKHSKPARLAVGLPSPDNLYGFGPALHNGNSAHPEAKTLPEPQQDAPGPQGDATPQARASRWSLGKVRPGRANVWARRGPGGAPR